MPEINNPEVSIDLTGYEPPAARESFSEAVVDRAHRLLLDPESCQPKDADRTSWIVKSIRNNNLYWVTVEAPDADDPHGPLPEKTTCTCSNGRNVAGGPQCYHLAAVLLLKGWSL